MNRYKFDDSGSGCLHWLMTGIQHLEDAGLVELGASLRLCAFHHKQVEQHLERHLMPIRRGTFYWCVIVCIRFSQCVEAFVLDHCLMPHASIGGYWGAQADIGKCGCH